MFGLFLPAALALSVSAQAGDACKGFKVEADAFTGTANVTARIQSLHQFTAVGLALELKAGVAEMHLTAKEGGAIDGQIPAGVEVPFLFEGGEVVNLTTSRANALKSYVVETTIMTNLPFTFGVDATQLHKLSSTPLQTVRIPISSGTWDWSPKGKVQKKLMAAAACLAEYLPAEE
jgi:hypothetical protein